MQLMWLEVFDDLRKMSIGVHATGLTLGLLLWLFGWLGHRFWIVVLSTAGAGILGMYLNPVFGAKSLLVGVLLAISAGLLALSLVRVLAFAAGGLALLLAMRAVVPAWDEPLLPFLLGGLSGILLFRLWTMALTSFVGTFLMAHFGLSLVERLAKLDAAALVESRSGLVTWTFAGVTLVGLGLQLLLERWRARRRAVAEVVEEERPEEYDDLGQRQKISRRFYRRAG